MSGGLITNQDFFDGYAEAVVVVTNRIHVAYVNPAFTQLTGYTAHNLPAGFMNKLIAAPIVNNYRQIGGTTKNGAAIKLNISESVITLTDQTQAALFTCIAIPVADSGEQKFYELANASPAMIFLEDKNGQAFYFNTAWLSFTGRPLATQLGSQWQSIIHPANRSVDDDIKLSIANRTAYAYELQLMNFNGAYRHIFMVATPVFLNGHIFNGYMKSCLDITEVKEAQNKITQLTYALKQSNEELEQFTYVTSHDLQEPLRMIAGYVQLIQKNIEKGNLKSIDEFMGFVLSGTARMQMLITDLVQLSRINRKGASFAPVNVKEVIEVAIAQVTKSTARKNAKISTGAMPVVTGDTFQLVILFENLLDNALKFTSLDREPVVSITAEEKEEKFIFEVKDNGIGIDNKFHKRIFAIFQTLHTRGEYEGTGIGLAVCKKIVERHGGEIWVEQNADGGSKFFFTIKKQL